MADLDDFFAKKDRKKSKSKKFVTADEVVKKLEDTSKKSDQKPRKLPPTAEGDEQNPKQTEDEWKEFEEERKDYTGLKIGTLTISEEEQIQQNFVNDPEGNAEGQSDDGEGNSENSERRGGPWKKVAGEGGEQVVAAPVAVQEPPKPTANVYISPALRNQLAQPLRSKLKKGVAPDLRNEEFFPTLGAEKPDTSKSKKDGTFEEVKHGSRVKHSDLPSAAPLSVGNRFTSLSSDAS